MELPKAPQPLAVQQETTPPPKPPPPAPQPSTPVEPAKPTSGEIVWTGVLGENACLIYNGRNWTPRGVVSGALPGMPVDLTIAPATVKVQPPPNPGSVVLLNTGPRVTTVRIHWTAK